MAKIVFGGSFDPVHLGHINMASLASSQLNADVIFVPAKISVWKKESIGVEDKISMLKLAINGHPNFKIDRFEIEAKEDTTYSIDTIKHILDRYPNEKIYFLIGTDQVNSFHLWKSAEEISELVQIVFFNRPGYDISEENIKKYKMVEIKGRTIDISSTDIRMLDTLELPYEVLRYIEDNDLYFIKKVREYITDKRYHHSLSVAHLAYTIALSNELKNPTKAYIAGLLHDIAKEIPYEQAKEIMESYFKDYQDIGAWAFHQFVGRYIAEKEFKIKDQEILSAIEYHATGNKGMSMLAKIIYAADKIDPTRGYDSKDMISAMEANADKGFELVLKTNMEYLESHNKCVKNVLTSKCLKYYLKNY